MDIVKENMKYEAVHMPKTDEYGKSKGQLVNQNLLLPGKWLVNSCM